ncbi:hypothetical protein QN222_20250 [Sinorhizobium sp. 6-70]|nr:hypothetical protein [Sinorhizobium sp. 6-70]
MELEIEAVHQPERLEFLFGKFPADTPLNLPPELLGPIPQELPIIFVIAIDPGKGRSRCG